MVAAVEKMVVEKGMVSKVVMVVLAALRVVPLAEVDLVVVFSHT